LHGAGRLFTTEGGLKMTHTDGCGNRVTTGPRHG
jgi:hypothetical protein